MSRRPLRSGAAQALPVRFVCSALGQHVALHISASYEHKPQDRSSTLAFVFLRFGVEAYARRATDKHTGVNPSKDHRWGLRLLREPIGLHTPLLTESDRPSRDPFGLRASCSRSTYRDSVLVVFPGKDQAVLVECLGFLSRLTIISSTRVIVWFQHTSTCLARRINCCAPFLLKIRYYFDATGTPPRSFAINIVPLRHVASTSIMFAALPITVQHIGLAVNTGHIPPDSLL